MIRPAIALLAAVGLIASWLAIRQGRDGWAFIATTVAILLASINVFGGFAVTRRMLAMFSRS